MIPLRPPTCHRALMLVLMSLLAVMFGARWLFNPASADLGLLASLADPCIYGWLFTAVGGLGVVAAVLDVGWDAVGFAPMAGVWLFWALGHMMTVLDPHYPDHSVGRQMARGVIFLVFAAVVLVAAHMPDSRYIRRVYEEG